jgi:hypothetical protein
MNYKVVTTMGPGGYEAYGRRMIESFKKYWPADAQLVVYVHDTALPTEVCEGVHFKSLDDHPSFMRQKMMWGEGAKDGPSLNYSFKSIALVSEMEDVEWLAFVDADTEWMRPVDEAFLQEVFDPSYTLTYLYRRTIGESEGSWFAFHTGSEIGKSLVVDYWALYDSGEVRHYKKAHDNAVLDRLLTISVPHGVWVKNLCEGALGLDGFHQSILGAYAVHYKGPKKDEVAVPDMMQPQRYQLLRDFAVQACKIAGNSTIVETGTHNGTRAISLAEALFAAGHKEVKYIGFDTFGQGNDRAAESDTKPDWTLERVEQRLKNYQTVQARKGLNFLWTLVEGDTRETLKGLTLTDTPAFVYLDGGHSEETVRNDYEALKNAKFIVFDDVLEPEPNAPEGPFKVFSAVEGRPKFFVQTGDGYANCVGTIGLGILGTEGLPMIQFRQPLRVKPHDSVDKELQLGYIEENSKFMERWATSLQVHRGTALLVSAGPTLKEYVKEIKRRQKSGDVVFCVKHALPALMAEGVSPDYVVVLDPRPLNEKSTHGVQRRDLFNELGPKSKVLLATMTNPEVTQHIMDKVGPKKVLGWHAFNQLVLDKRSDWFRKGLVIAGGTCAATRQVALAHVMGFRRFVFYGYDFFYPEGTDPATLKQQLMEIEYGPQEGPRTKYWTTGELIAAIQDLETLVPWLMNERCSCLWRGDGIGGKVWASKAAAYVEPLEPPPKWG